MTAPSQDATPSPAAVPATGAPATPAPTPELAKAYGRYRVLAYVVGTILVVLVLVAVPLKYAADIPQLVSIIGPVHGVLYIVYLLATFDMATKAKFSVKRALLVMLAGTIPFVSFVAERSVTGVLRERLGR